MVHGMPEQQKKPSGIISTLYKLSSQLRMGTLGSLAHPRFKSPSTIVGRRMTTTASPPAPAMLPFPGQPLPYELYNAAIQ